MNSRTTIQVFIIWLAGLAAAAQYGKISAVFDLLPQIYPDNLTSLGFAVSLVGAVGIVFGVVAGRIVSSIGLKKSLVAALVLGALISCIQSFSLSYPVFLATRVIEGFSHLGIVVAAPTLIAQITPDKHRNVALVLWSTFFSVSFAILAYFGGYVVDAIGVWGLFASHGVIMACLACVLLVLLPTTRDNTEADVSTKKTLSIFALHRKIYASPFINAPAIGWLFYTFCFVSILTVLPPYIPAEQRVQVMTIMPLAAIFVSLVFGTWGLRYLSAVRVIEIGFLLCAAATLWLGFAASPIWPAIALSGAMGLVQGSSFAAVAQLNKVNSDRAFANGAMAQMGNLGNTLGTPVIAFTLYHGDLVVASLLIFALFLAGSVLHLVLGRLRIRQSKTS